MRIKSLLQVFGRPWLIEESQALYWAKMAEQMLFSKTLDAAPGMDPRTIAGQYKAYAGLAYADIFRVDQAANMDPKGPVQVIRMDGPLMEDDYCGSPGMTTMQQAIKAANADAEIQSIVLYSKSPGGTVAGTHNLAKEVKASKKPVVTFVNNMMCSAAYWIGSSAAEIIADDESGGYNSMIGSIGVKFTFIDDTENLRQRGLKIVSVYADQSSRKGKYAEDIMNGDYTRLKEEMNKLADVFIKGVNQNRAGKLNIKEENVFEGDVYDVKQSLKLGLIDKTGSFDYAVKRSLQIAKTIRA